MKKPLPFSCITLAFALLGTPSALHAQNWTVGVPVDMLIYSQMFLGGCTPNADYTFTMPVSQVAGVDFIARVVALDPPSGSVTISPGMVDATVGESFVIDLELSRYVMCAAGTNNATIEFRAVGIPTQAGDPHPCTTSAFWISNLLICPEGLSPIIGDGCTVQADNTGIEDAVGPVRVVHPSAAYGQQLMITGAVPDAVTVFDATGRLVTSAYAASSIDCSQWMPGCYVACFEMAGGRSIRERFWVQP